MNQREVHGTGQGTGPAAIGSRDLVQAFPTNELIEQAYSWTMVSAEFLCYQTILELILSEQSQSNSLDIGSNYHHFEVGTQNQQSWRNPHVCGNGSGPAASEDAWPSAMDRRKGRGQARACHLRGTVSASWQRETWSNTVQISPQIDFFGEKTHQASTKVGRVLTDA